MILKEINIGNSPPPENRETVTTDHTVQTFTITLRSIYGVGKTELTNHLQKMWEVLEVDKTEHIEYVR